MKGEYRCLQTKMERLVAEMRNRGEQLEAKVLRLEDERSAERTMFGSKMQSVRDECTEFDQQYNHVLDCWRLAEERSRVLGMELHTEMGMFHEVNQYLSEMQQHLGNVMQEDYGAGLRIQELEATINNMRTQYQQNTVTISQETREEVSEMRGRADRIIVEANEAIAAKDTQQFHERELITDEAMTLKQRNDVLMNELSQAQHEAIQTFQFAYGEQKSVDLARSGLADEEVAVRNLRGELSVMESALNLERHKAARLHDEMDDHRRRYEQRLSLIMSNPNVINQGINTVDVASKVEIQRLKHELSEAQSALVVPYQPQNRGETGQEMLEARFEALQQEHEEMKAKLTFKYWNKKVNEIADDTQEAKAQTMSERRAAYNEKKLYEDEEQHARRMGEENERLRRERNEWRDYYDALFAEWGEEDEHNEDEEHEVRSTISEAAVSAAAYSSSKISRKEADKITIPNWPKIHELEFWKSQVTSNIVAASGDLDHEAWIAWIAPTFRMSPDIDGILSNSGDTRFNSVDVKLASAQMAMMQNGGDQAREVLNEARLRMAKGCRGNTPTLMKGRQVGYDY